MLNEKIELTQDLKNFIIRTRNEHNKKLVDLENKSKFKHKAGWFSQIEGKRTRTIKRDDIIDIFKIILDISEKEAEEYIQSYLITNEFKHYNNYSMEKIVNNIVIKDDFSNDLFLPMLDDLKNCINEVYSNLKDDEKGFMIKSINTLIKNLYSDTRLTNTLLAIPLYMISSIDIEISLAFVTDMQNIFKRHISNAINKQMSINNDTFNNNTPN